MRNWERKTTEITEDTERREEETTDGTDYHRWKKSHKRQKTQNFLPAFAFLILSILCIHVQFYLALEATLGRGQVKKTVLRCANQKNGFYIGS